MFLFPSIVGRRARPDVIMVGVAMLFVCSAATYARADPIAQASPAAAPVPATSPAAAPASEPSTSPAPPPVPGGRGGEPPAATIPKTGAAFGHLPVIDIVPWYTSPLFYTVPGIGKTGQPATNPLKNTGTDYQPVDVGGTVRLPITPNIFASFDRNIEGTINVMNARVTTAPTKKGVEAYTYPVFAKDVVLVYRLDEQYQRFQLEEGLYFRHRSVGGTNTSDTPYPNTISSTEAHFGYVGLSYALPAIPWLLNSFFTVNINGDTQAIDHHVGCGTAKTFTSGNFSVPCVHGVFDPNPNQNRVYETDQFVQLTVPLQGNRGLILSAQDRWGALNFYENAAFPYRWASSQTYFLTKRFTRFFTLSLRTRSQWAVAQGAPYVKPNSQHNGTIDVLADFKVDLNTLH